MDEVVVTSGVNLQNSVSYGDGFGFTTDEPARLGGDGAGADPYTLILAALGSCISMTLTLYARRKGWPLARVTVRLRQQRVHAKDCAECETKTDGFVHRIERQVSVEGELTDEQRARLLEIAHKCPVHRALTSEIVIADFRE
ncbi:MAG TPA: OsmC family protein [Pyrinomonadaceae bacterium]|jgi:putative redox protein|nr:OsmC family protein [Pyrinomonadaceae bacterium]